jgi:DNA-binding response OmpR family regulator
MNPGSMDESRSSGGRAHPSQRARKRRVAAKQQARDAHVLVADCDPGVPQRVADVVRVMGYAVTARTSLDDALREAAVGSYAALVASVPVLDDEHLRALHLLRRTLPKAPLVVVTSDDSLETRRRALELRAFFHAVRPLDRSELRGALAAAVTRSRPARA